MTVLGYKGHGGEGRHGEEGSDLAVMLGVPLDGEHLCTNLLRNICEPCKDVSLPKAPSNWFNKELNGQ